MTIRVTLIVPIKGKEDAYVRRKCDLPIPPFIGLTIGAKVVTAVYVCQGFDDSSDIEVWCEPVEECIAILWCKHDSLWKLDENE